MAIASLNHSNDPIAIGGTETFTANVVNQGANADSVTFILALPAGTSVVSAPESCVTANNLITCALGPVAGGTGTLVSIKVMALFTHSITVFVTVSSGTESDTNLANNTASDTVQVRFRPFIRAGLPPR